MNLRKFREELDKMCKAGPPSDYQKLWHKIHKMLDELVFDIIFTKVYYERILTVNPSDEVSQAIVRFCKMLLGEEDASIAFIHNSDSSAT